MGKIFTFLAFFLAICSLANAQKFTTQWTKSVADNTLPEWYGSYTERGIAATNQHVFVVSRSNPDQVAVKCMEAFTGTELNDLNVTGVAEGGFLLNDIEASDDGQILACNLALYHEQWVPDGSWEFKIYKWTNKDAAPEVFIDFDNSNHLRMGDSFTVKGDLTNDAIIYVPVAKSNKVFRWEVIAGVLNETPEIIELQDLVKSKENTAVLGDYPKIAALGVTKNDPFVYCSTGVFPMQYSANGSTIEGQLNAGNFISETMDEAADESAVITFTTEGKTYLAALGLMQASGNNNTQVKAIDITNGLEEAEKPFYSAPLGMVENVQWNGDIDYAVIDGEVYVYLLYSNAGLAAFKFDPNAAPEIKVPVTATGWRRCAIDSIEGESTQPAWLTENARTLAYGNGHLYVPVCGAANAVGRILILNAKDGSVLAKELNVDAVNAANDFQHDGTIRISDVEVDDAGHILACNVRLTGTPFKIFAWDDEDSEPQKIIELTPPYGDEDGGAGWQQTAYYMDVKGDIKGDAVIVAARSNYQSVYKWVIKGGVVQNDGNPYVQIYDLPNGGNWGAYGSACVESASEEANIWVDGDGIDPICFDKDKGVVTVMPKAISTSESQPHRTTVKYLTYAERNYILEWNWVWADHTRLITVPDSIQAWDDAEFQEVGTYMGQNPNALTLGDCDYYVKGDTLYIYTISTNNGIKLDKIFKEAPEVVVPVTEEGWRRCAIDSVGGVSSKPQWLGLNSRAVAANKDRIYVVNCANDNQPGEILVLDAKNGSKLDKKLKVAPLNAANNVAAESTIRISDVEVDDAGHILATNVRVAGALSIYAWDDEDSDPYILVEVTPPYDIEDPSATWHQASYYFDVKGDIKGDAVIIAARSNYPSTYKWVIKEGVVQNEGNPIVMIHDLVEGAHWGAYGSACVESADENTNVWVDGDAIDPVCYDVDGSILGIIPPEVSSNPGAPHRTAVKFVAYANKSFILEWNWAWADHTRLIDVSGDLMALTEDNLVEIGGYMGQEANPLMWGDVDYFIENDILNVVTISTNNGIKLDKFFSSTVAVQKIENKGEILVYPNPAKNEVTISYTSGCKTVEFINILGATVKEVTDVTNKAIDISELHEGVYLVRITPNKGDVEVRKIIKH